MANKPDLTKHRRQQLARVEADHERKREWRDRQERGSDDAERIRQDLDRKLRQDSNLLRRSK